MGLLSAENRQLVENKNSHFFSFSVDGALALDVHWETIVAQEGAGLVALGPPLPTMVAVRRMSYLSPYAVWPQPAS